MPQPFKTFDMLPDLQGRRFTTLDLGSSNVDTLRTEFSRLAAVVAAVCGVGVKDLTYQMVDGLDLDAVRAWRADQSRARDDDGA